MTRTLVLIWFAALCIMAPTAAQGEGYVGVYGDALGTVRCVPAPPWVATTLYILGIASSGSGGGIIGAEFRIEFENRTGYYMNYVAPDSAQVLGDPLSAGGSNLTWPSCRLPNGSGKINLGTIQVFNAGTGGPTNIVVKHREPPTSSEHPCPLFVLCDAPTYTLRCTTAPSDSISCLNR